MAVCPGFGGDENHPAATGRFSSQPESDLRADLVLVRAALSGQEDAIEELTTRLRCVTRMLSAQNARMGSPLDAHDLADLAQETLMILLKKLRLYAGRAGLERWIYRVCALELHNGVRRRRRRWRRTREVADGDQLVAGAGPDRDLGEEIRLALEQLPPPEAEVIRLKHFEGLTFEEIGVRLATSPNSAKTRYYRGLGSLEELLGPRLDLRSER